MLARAHTFTIDGPDARHVTVELDVRSGLPAFTIVGLADMAVREARERIQSAIRNSGFDWPARRITANLAPGDLRKAGPGLDLALACALLAATGQLPGERLARVAMFGELGLDGTVRPAHGTLAVAQAARRAGLDGLAVALSSSREAALVDGLAVAPLTDLAAAERLLKGAPAAPAARGRLRDVRSRAAASGPCVAIHAALGHQSVSVRLWGRAQPMPLWAPRAREAQTPPQRPVAGSPRPADLPPWGRRRRSAGELGTCSSGSVGCPRAPVAEASGRGRADERRDGREHARPAGPHRQAVAAAAGGSSPPGAAQPPR